MLEDAQTEVKEISGEFHKRTVTTSAFFFALLMEQVGQCARKYIHQGREAEDLPADIADIIVACLCYLNWLDESAGKAFEKALEKHKRDIELLMHAR
jgi:NTP pyrophosphatase (non-canonical NTP hydrolase)